MNYKILFCVYSIDFYILLGGIIIRINHKILHIAIISVFVIVLVISNSYSPGREFKKNFASASVDSNEEKIADILPGNILIYGIYDEFIMVQTITNCMYLDIYAYYYILAFVVLAFFFFSQYLIEKINNVLDNDIYQKEKVLICIDMYCIQNIILYITLVVAYKVGDFLRLKIKSIVNYDSSVFVFAFFMGLSLWLMIVLFIFIFLPYLILGQLPYLVYSFFNNVLGMCIIVLLEIIIIGFIWHKISGFLINKSFICIFFPIRVIIWFFRKINLVQK